jgi:hypothetical protein
LDSQLKGSEGQCGLVASRGGLVRLDGIKAALVAHVVNGLLERVSEWRPAGPRCARTITMDVFSKYDVFASVVEKIWRHTPKNI